MFWAQGADREAGQSKSSGYSSARKGRRTLLMDCYLDMVGGLVGLFDLMRPDQRKLINKDASE
jgi:hypothetical protein